MISRPIKLSWSFLLKYEKEIYKLKHFLFQYFSKVLAGTHLINEICLTVYPILLQDIFSEQAYVNDLLGCAVNLLSRISANK